MVALGGKELAHLGIVTVIGRPHDLLCTISNFLKNVPARRKRSNALDSGKARNELSFSGTIDRLTLVPMILNVTTCREQTRLMLTRTEKKSATVELKCATRSIPPMGESPYATQALRCSFQTLEHAARNDVPIRRSQGVEKACHGRRQGDRLRRLPSRASVIGERNIEQK